MSVPPEVLEIKEKLSLLKEKDRDFRVFGSSTHRYELFAPLPEKRVEKFETDYRIKLPADYKFFLTQIGDGGAGPFYGLIPFEKSFSGCQPDEFFRWSGETEVEFTEDADYDEWHEHRRGVLNICEQGCANNNFLVVNGESYGRIWADFYDNLVSENVSFGKFYDNWLTRNVKRLEMIPLIHSVKPGMSKAELVKVFGSDGRETQIENNERTVRLVFSFVPAAFVLSEGILVRTDDYSKMLV